MAACGGERHHGGLGVAEAKPQAESERAAEHQYEVGSSGSAIRNLSPAHPGCGASESGIRQATTTSQSIHATSRTKAATMGIDSLFEKPSEPTTQPCTR